MRSPLLPRADPADGTAGVSSYDISLEKQEVIVKTALPLAEVEAKIKKTGKEVKSSEVVA